MKPDAPDIGDYRLTPKAGPRVRTDIIDIYIFRRAPSASPEFLQLRRALAPLADTWHPIMGHIEGGETALMAAARELREEVGLAPCDPAILGSWALEQVHPYYIAQIDAIVLSPRFALEVVPGWEPALNDEHQAGRWVETADLFMWPGQRAAVDEIVATIMPMDSSSREALRIRI